MTLRSKVSREQLPSRRCVYTKRNGEPCKRWAFVGGTLCVKHGGQKRVIRAASMRRLAAEFGDAMNPDRVLAELACVAYFDIGDLFDEDGNLLPVRQWPEALRRAVAGTEVAKRNLVSGDDRTDEVLKVRMMDKVKALVALATTHGLMKEQREHSGELTISWKDSAEPKDE